MLYTKSEIIIFLSTTTTIILFLFVIVLMIIYYYKKNQYTFLQQMEIIRQSYEKNTIQAQLEVQENILQSISSEIHDNISLTLTLAKLRLSTAKTDNTSLTLQTITESEEMLGKAIDDLRTLSHRFNNHSIEQFGLIRTLEDEVEKVNRIGKVVMQIQVKGETRFFDGRKELIIFRIIQESFNNLLKHSHASQAWLQLEYSGKQLDVKVSDNGTGMQDVNQEKLASCQGLSNMKRRSILLNGTIHFLPREGGGTLIHLSIPYTI